ncbi:hypothetical protein PISMIDRAFT_676867 [Pisolithus microcarpus 441]|uniref:Uncharacterized protein n=1 Tax=Pisolithus microcarpus 441 TaxID=765257 RepID=A0A0D0A1E2_9AGAM|nr:hypothetical protein PISMIDRAFT_676867 [Pisolithus microcarpus 441]
MFVTGSWASSGAISERKASCLWKDALKRARSVRHRPSILFLAAQDAPRSYSLNEDKRVLHQLLNMSRK